MEVPCVFSFLSWNLIFFRLFQKVVNPDFQVDEFKTDEERSDLKYFKGSLTHNFRSIAYKTFMFYIL